MFNWLSGCIYIQGEAPLALGVERIYRDYILYYIEKRRIFDTKCEQGEKYCYRHDKAVATVPNVYIRWMTVFLKVLDVPRENQHYKLPLAVCHECFGLIKKTGLKWYRLLCKEGVTHFTVWFVPFPGLHRDSVMIRKYNVSHFAILWQLFTWGFLHMHGHKSKLFRHCKYVWRHIDR